MNEMRLQHLIRRMTHCIPNKHDPVSRAEWEWLHDMHGPFGGLVAELYGVRRGSTQFIWLEKAHLYHRPRIRFKVVKLFS